MKKLLIIIPFVLFSLHTISAKDRLTFTGGTSTYIEKEVLDKDGNIYVCGYSSSSWGNPVRAYKKYEDGFVAKYDSSFNLVWNTFLGDSLSDKCYDIKLDKSGNVYVCGYTGNSWGSTVRAYTASTDGFVAKLSTDGSLLWNSYLGGNYYDFCYGLSLDTIGNIYVCGYSSYPWGNPILSFLGSENGFLAKLNKNGTYLWNTFFSGGALSIGACYGVTTDDSSNVYVCGYSNTKSWGNPIRAYSGSRDGFAAKLTTNGTLSWNTFFGGSSSDECNDIKIDSVGNLYVCGYSSSTWGTPIRAYNSFDDAFVIKLTNSGNLLWNTFLGGTSYYAGGRSLALDSAKNIYLCGYSGSNWGTPVRAYTSSSSSYYDGCVVKLTNDGSLVWNTFLGLAANDYAYGIGLDNNGKIYVSGYSFGTWGNPINAYSGGTTSQGFLVRLTKSGSIDVLTDSSTTNLNKEYFDEIKINPNPVTGSFILSGVDFGQLVLFDVMGRVVFKSTLVGNSQVNVSSLSKGVYTAEIITLKGKVVKKLIKQ